MIWFAIWSMIWYMIWCIIWYTIWCMLWYIYRLPVTDSQPLIKKEHVRLPPPPTSKEFNTWAFKIKGLGQDNPLVTIKKCKSARRLLYIINAPKFTCKMCDFQSKSKRGLRNHIARKPTNYAENTGCLKKEMRRSLCLISLATHMLERWDP